jgi:hypothetical protein
MILFSKEIAFRRIGEKIYPYFSGLLGARIAVYRYSGDVRDHKINVATLGGVSLMEGRYLAVTVAHVFFESFSSETPPPKISGIYEVVIENGWPQIGGGVGTSIGLVAPRVLQHQKNPAIKALPEVIWDAELDWGLIELKDPALWKPSKLHLSPEVSMSLKPPSGPGATFYR